MRIALGVFALGILVFIGCVPTEDEDQKRLYIGGIPDQNESVLVRRFSSMADYLSLRLDVDVRYVSSIDYSAVVTAFSNGDIHLAWFGGFTGVQARVAVKGAKAIAQRSMDQNFRSVFIVHAQMTAQSLSDLQNTSFTFGSESSTSGHLMPRYFLLEEGIKAEEDFRGLPNFSGSHDKTWKLVESGAFDAGVLNKAVWDKAVAEDKVSLDKVRVLKVTDPYYDYNWTVRPDLDQHFGDGFTDNLVIALLEMQLYEEYSTILELFQAEKFISTNNDNYIGIESVARSLGMLK
ncbi:putative selenate ABC transporter substrate-binding protein [SAR202 cluster bacterium AD-804-J14_MRT_500m]|nr:putative selenate ABC transporter substrate-binding protein [SAR202 cluster bacterium AD-804-J14_MRT_500m]